MPCYEHEKKMKSRTIVNDYGLIRLDEVQISTNIALKKSHFVFNCFSVLYHNSVTKYELQLPLEVLESNADFW